MHLFYFANKKNVQPGIVRKIIETELVNRHHWHPDLIAKTSYKWIQTYLAISHMKDQATSIKRQTEQNKAQHRTAHSGQSGGGTKRVWSTIPMNPGDKNEPRK